MASEYDALLEAQPTQQKSEYDALLTPEQPKQEGGVLSGIAAGVGRLLNPVNLIQGALDIQPRSGLQEVLRTGRMLRDIVGGASIDETVRKEAPEVVQQQEALTGKYGTREQAAQITGLAAQAALLAVPYIHGKLGEIAGLSKPEVAPEAIPQTPETPVSDIVEPIPTVPEERFPSLLRSDENLRRGELQQQLNTERGFELVPEPPPDIAPAPTLEQTLETAQVPEQRVSPETGFTFPNEPIETSTGIQSETASIGGELNAVQEPSAGEVLQRQPEEVGATGGERTGVEQGVQGQETPQASTQEVTPVPPEQIPAETTPQLEVQPETPTSGVHAEALADRPIDTILAGEEWTVPLMRVYL